MDRVSVGDAERDENVKRLDFKPTEAVELGETIEAAVRALAKEAQREGQAKGRETRWNGGSSPKPATRTPRDESRRTTAQAAAAAGMDRRTYEKAKSVVASGDQRLIAEMDRTGKVNGVHKRLVVEQKAGGAREKTGSRRLRADDRTLNLSPRGVVSSPCR
jgi:hypothetical protein